LAKVLLRGFSMASRFDQYVTAPTEPPPVDMGNYGKSRFDQYVSPPAPAGYTGELPPSPAELEQRNRSFAGRVSNDFQKRNAMADEIVTANKAGQQGPLESIGQIAGKVVAGAGGDVINEGLKSAGTFLNSRLDAVTPDFAKPALEERNLYAKSAKNFVFNSDIGKAGIAAAQKGMDAYKQFATENPRAARDIESVVDLGTFLPLAKGATLASDATGGVLSNAGSAIADSADARAAMKKSGFVQELISPKATPTVKADQFSRSTEQGLLRNRVVEPTPHEASMIDAVSQLPVSKYNSTLKNYNIISDANQQEAENLINALKQNDVAIAPEEIQQSLLSTFDNLKKNPYITGDAETSASRVMQGMVNAIGKNEQTASGLLQARKDFDSWVKSQKGVGVFDPQRESAVTTAVQGIRQAVNDLVDSKVPDVGFKQSLQKQSSLYRAMDNIETKGGLEAPNAVKRFAEKSSNLIPGKGIMGKGAVALGAGSAAAFAPALAAGIGATYGAGKLLTSPTAQKALGSTLDAAGKALQGKNPFSMAEIMKMPPAQGREAMKKFRPK
jgi:hypothetical protein